MNIKKLNEQIKKYLNEDDFHEIFMSDICRDLNDVHRAQNYLQFHYDFPYSTDLKRVYNIEQIKENGSYFVVSGGRGSLFIKGKYIGGITKSLSQIQARDIIYKIPPLKRITLTKEDKLAAKLGFDYFDFGSWGILESNVRKNFLQHFGIEDVEYNIPSLASETKIGRVGYRKDGQYFILEFNNFSCSLEYFKAKIKPATEEDRARNTFIRDQD